MFSSRVPWILAVGLTLLILAGTPAPAEIYKFIDDNGVWHFTNMKTDRRYRPFTLRTPKKPPGTIYRSVTKYDGIILKASRQFQVDSSLIKAVIKAESDFNHRAVSKRGAQGLMQLMPGTANEMDVKDPFNPIENILGGTRYLSLLLKRFQDNKTLALAAYNAGPEEVELRNGVPPFPETRTFVKRVMNHYQAYKGRVK
ncbi:MAG: lytic transglycosylase domain-containing protein [Deltaproteobacteria bacterium]|nr:lytic transglycosylase domain-containing protein [Deltaproteobacteria bacterium]